jgi:hypothetical protein
MAVVAVEAELEALARTSPADGRDRLTAELAQTVIDQARSLRVEAGRIAETLERGGVQLARVAPPVAEPVLADDDESGRSEGLGPNPSEGLRMVVEQMSATGSPPAEIAARLRRDFGVTDAEMVVEEVLSAR